jgi:hypothetical protein
VERHQLRKDKRADRSLTRSRYGSVLPKLMIVRYLGIRKAIYSRGATTRILRLLSSDIPGTFCWFRSKAKILIMW